MRSEYHRVDLLDKIPPHWCNSGRLVSEVTSHFGFEACYMETNTNLILQTLGKKPTKTVTGDIVGPAVELATYNKLNKYVAKLSSKYLHLYLDLCCGQS